MSDDIQSRLNKVPPFDTDVPMIEEVKKIAEQQTTGKQVVEEPKEEIKEEVVQETPKDRTAEQFAKLTEHNKQLSEEVKVLRENVLESLKPKTQEFTPQVVEKIDESVKELGQDKVDDVFADLIDENGYLDDKMLKSTLTQLVNDAKLARKEAEEARRKAEEADRKSTEKFNSIEENKEVKRVHKKYPQIDPNSKEFNEDFWDDVRKELATAPILRGETLTFEEAADSIWEKRYASKKPVVTEPDPKQNMIEDAKRNINAVRNNSFRSDYYTQADTTELIRASQLGKKGAIAERLKRAGL